MTKSISITNTPGKLEGTIELPASKSISNRALILQALSKDQFSIQNLSDADDTQLMDQLLHTNEKKLDCKNAGTTFRFLTAYLAITQGKRTLTGSDRMKGRPIKPLVDALLGLGADIRYLENEGYPPLEINGKKLKGGSIQMDASVSSQFVSALLLIAPFTKEGIHLEFSGIPVSRPYFNMTVKMLQFFNVKVKQKSNEIAVFPKKKIPDKNIEVEPDWTSASYWLALAAIFPGSELYFPNLSDNSWQGDRALTSLLPRFGLDFQFENKSGLRINSNGNYPENFEALLTDHPDLVPTLATLCTVLKVPFDFQGLDHLKHKETDRLRAIRGELNKMGAHIEDSENSLTCNEFSKIPENLITLETYEDHRLAMSWVLPASLNSNISIANPEVVEKSYPNFWEQLGKLGFSMEEDS